MRVLVTGADGFVGRALVAALIADGVPVRRATRTGQADPQATGAETVATGDIGPDTDWTAALAGCTHVVHLAGRAHHTDEQGEAGADAHRRVNFEGTRSLALAAAAARVQRLVFASTIGVHRESGEAPVRETDPLEPKSPYARAKRDAEVAIELVGREAGLEWTVVRPPLVYGPNCPGNLARLMRLVARRWPLPLGAVRNRRSLVGVENLADFLRIALKHPAARNQAFVVADDEVVSTADIIRALARGMGFEARLLPVPVGLLRAIAGLFGRAAAVDRLCGSLPVDASKARERLGWLPRTHTLPGLEEAARASTGNSDT